MHMEGRASGVEAENPLGGSCRLPGQRLLWSGSARRLGMAYPLNVQLTKLDVLSERCKRKGLRGTPFGFGRCLLKLGEWGAGSLVPKYLYLYISKHMDTVPSGQISLASGGLEIGAVCWDHKQFPWSFSEKMKLVMTTVVDGIVSHQNICSRPNY